MGAHLAFIDESGFLLIPPVRKTWALRGQTPICRHRQRHDRLSLISCLAASPRRKRMSLYFNVSWSNLTQQEVCHFLRQLLRQIRRPLVVIWDNGAVHKGVLVRKFLRKHRRLHLEALPPYAPELNPDEGVWAQAKSSLANGRPDTLPDLWWHLYDVLRKISNSQSALRACVHQSELPSFFD